MSVLIPYHFHIQWIHFYVILYREEKKISTLQTQKDEAKFNGLNIQLHHVKCEEWAHTALRSVLGSVLGSVLRSVLGSVCPMSSGLCTLWAHGREETLITWTMAMTSVKCRSPPLHQRETDGVRGHSSSRGHRDMMNVAVCWAAEMSASRLPPAALSLKQVSPQRRQLTGDVFTVWGRLVSIYSLFYS